MANVVEHRNFPALKIALEGKRCVQVSGGNNALFLALEDGTVLSVKVVSGPGADSEWNDVTTIAVNEANPIELM